MSIEKKKFKLLCLVNVYRIVLDLIFGLVSSNFYALNENASEYLIDDFNLIKVIISYILMNFCFFIVPYGSRKLSNYVVQLFYILMFIPMFSVYGIMNLSTIFMFYTTVSFSVLAVCIKSLRNIRLPIFKIDRRITKVILYIVVLWAMFKMYKIRGLNFEALDLGKIYKYRTDIIYSSDLIKYTWGWAYTIFVPFLMYMAYIEKRKIEFVISILLQITMYFIIPYKSIIFGPVLIFIISFIIKNYIKNNYSFSMKFISMFTMVLLIGVLLYIYFGEVWTMFMSSLRIANGPAYLKFKHFNIFSELPKLFYSEGTIGRIFGLVYPYDKPSGYVVAASTGILSNENSGYLASAYDNLGFAGMILMTLLLSFILKAFDALTNHKNFYIVVSLSIYQFYILNDGDLITAVSAGILPLFLLLYIYEPVPRTNFRKVKSKKKYLHINAY